MTSNEIGTAMLFVSWEFGIAVQPLAFDASEPRNNFHPSCSAGQLNVNSESEVRWAVTIADCETTAAISA
jgi:hypothetical protein